jgi:VanZ family protein
VSNGDRAQRTRAWIAVGVWIGLIFVMGTDTFSSSDTRGWLRTLIFRFIPGLTDADLDSVEFVARKGMHMALYFGLGALGFRSLRLQAASATRMRVLALALALAAAVAVADETRQAFLPKRTGSVYDVAIDTAGATGGALLLVAWTNRRRDHDS